MLRDARGVDRVAAARVRDLPHPDAVPEHAALPPDGGGRAAAPPGLVALRHRALRVPAEADDSGAARGGGWVDLPASLRLRIHLGAAAEARDGGGAVSGHVAALQAEQLAVEVPHRATDHPCRMDAARAAHPVAAPRPPRSPRPGG